MSLTSCQLASIFNKMHLPKVKAITLYRSIRICLQTAGDPGEECCFYFLLEMSQLCMMQGILAMISTPE